MNKCRENRDYAPPIGRGSVVELYEKIGTAVFRLCRLVVLGIAVVVTVSVCTGDWGLKSALADRKPVVGLTVTGQESAEVNMPYDIKVRLFNPGAATQDSRLRLYVQDEMDREVRLTDIKLDVQEGESWEDVQVEAIDGGVMGAIGAEGQPQKERHQHGGFAIGNKANKVWRLRVTFRLPGRYSVVVAVSPNNGETQLAQPASLKVEVL